ncbi:MAG: DUF4304 domain-containing protein [Bacteroidetes bacterium]|jgi:hypothetical protein|nr:DUF4304 domain-containing protein [Bacteroidota bacterium]
MKKEIKEFFSELHADFFKPRGFRKINHRFRREKERTIEIVDFQGSAWNQSSGDWTFYINLGLGIKEYIPFRAELHFKEAHGMGRIADLVPAAPQEFSLSRENRNSLKEKIMEMLDLAIVELPKHEKDVHRMAMAGSMSPIPLPDTWRNEINVQQDAARNGASHPAC